MIRTTNGSNIVRLIVPHSSYSVGDDFKFTGFAAPFVIDNIPITPGTYTVTGKGTLPGAPPARGFEYIEFIPVPGTNATNEFIYGDIDTDDFRIDNYSRAFQYLGLDPKTPPPPATYNPDDPLLSLSNRDPVTNKHREGIIINTRSNHFP